MMKTIRFLLVSLFVMLGTAVFAQDIVIHKTDGTTEIIENADSVVYDVKDYGYYREASEWEAQNSTTGWIKLTSNNQTIPTGKNVNIAVATVNNTMPTLTAASNLGGTMNCQVFSATEGGFTQKITINGKEYYFWISAEILPKNDNRSINIKQ